MGDTSGDFIEYAHLAIAEFNARTPVERNRLVDELSEFDVSAVLDIGCSAGHEMVPFRERFDAFCVGVDKARELGSVRIPETSETTVEFVVAEGEILPFGNSVFDVVVCRVTLPLMDNTRALNEMARVLKSGGFIFLRVHSPLFYFSMIGRRFLTFNAKQLAYPVLSLVNGVWHSFTDRSLTGRLWKGKEVYQTRGWLRKQLRKRGLQIVRELPDGRQQSPSFLIRKTAMAQHDAAS